MTESLAAAIARAGSPVQLLRNAQARPTIFPVTAEFSNWRSEQQSWQKTVALLDQSHHMTDLFIRGRDALRLLSDLGVNSFARFQVDNAKQFIAVNDEGYLIGDAILFYLADEEFDLVGHQMGDRLGAVPRRDRRLRRHLRARRQLDRARRKPHPVPVRAAGTERT